jgi:hypothetical protein
MGPKLNYPKCNRILEQKQLKAFILNPSSFRHGKMPKPANLNSKYRRNRLLFRIHGKSQAITRFEYSLLLDITTASRLRHFFSFRPKQSHMRII